MSEPLNDSPTHRWTILQASLTQIKEDLLAIRARRNAVVERQVKAKANSKVERAATIDGQLKRLFAKLERQIASLDEDMEAIEDNMNKARGLILEASDGEVALTKVGSDA
jgi:hypothetical protein